MTDQNGLSPREIEILELVAQGKSNKEIAQVLFLSVNTIHTHLRNIFRKINVSSRTEATLYAIENKLVQLPGAEPLSTADTTPSPSDLEATKQGFFRRYWWIAAIFLLVLVVGGVLLAFPNILRPPSNQNDIQAEGQFQELAPLPEARSELAFIGHNNFIYAIGGKTQKGITGRTDRYDPQTNTWERLADKPTPVSEINAAIIGDLIYIPGGMGTNQTPENIMEAYDPSKDAWLRLAPPPAPTSTYALTSFEGRIYLFGGSDGRQPLKSVYMYDPSEDTWSETTPVPTARMFASAAVAGGKIYVVGGLNEKGSLCTCEVYTPSMENGSESPWESCEPLPQGRYKFGLVSLVDTLYLDGGLGEETNLPALSFSPFGDSAWQIRNTLEISTGETRATLLGGLIYIMNDSINGIKGFSAYQPSYIVYFPIIK